MLKEEFIKACEMRADGYTYQEIADDLGYTRQHIHQTIKEMLTNDGYQISPTTIYPNLERVIKVQYKTVKEFARQTGFKYIRICSILNGKTRVLLEEAFYFAKLFDKDIDYLFR